MGWLVAYLTNLLALTPSVLQIASWAQCDHLESARNEPQPPMSRPILQFARWRRPGTLVDLSNTSSDVTPSRKKRRASRRSVWYRFLAWLCEPVPPKIKPQTHRLHSVRAKFLAVLAGLDGDDVDALRASIVATHSLRDLWHLRAATYRVVHAHRNQPQAEQTLMLLNQCFPRPA